MIFGMMQKRQNSCSLKHANVTQLYGFESKKVYFFLRCIFLVFGFSFQSGGHLKPNWHRWQVLGWADSAFPVNYRY
jgi:hypothetical protein